MLIQRIYQVDPLVCPKCGGTMKIISFIEARQDDVIRKILEHCGLWRAPPPRGPPPAAREPVGVSTSMEATENVEVDGDFLEHLRRERQGEQMELRWED
jgi:hypothetical protein